MKLFELEIYSLHRAGGISKVLLVAAASIYAGVRGSPTIIAQPLPTELRLATATHLKL